MLPSVTTTHAIPRSQPSSGPASKETAVRCSYCLAILGRATDQKRRQELQSAHKCAAEVQARKPAATIPYN